MREGTSVWGKRQEGRGQALGVESQMPNSRHSQVSYNQVLFFFATASVYSCDFLGWGRCQVLALTLILGLYLLLPSSFIIIYCPLPVPCRRERSIPSQVALIWSHFQTLARRREDLPWLQGRAGLGCLQGMVAGSISPNLLGTALLAIKGCSLPQQEGEARGLAVKDAPVVI